MVVKTGGDTFALEPADVQQIPFAEGVGARPTGEVVGTVGAE